MERVEIINILSGDISRIFGGLLCYSFLTGRFAYGVDGDGSDIDVVSVFYDGVEKEPEFRSKVNDFVRAYLCLHKLSNHVPDVFFPGEYVSDTQVKESISGRGYSLHKGRLALPIVSDESFWFDTENEYRAWRSMSAFNNAQLLTGDRARFEVARDSAWTEIVKFLAMGLDRFDTTTALDYISARGEGYLGVSSAYQPAFSAAESGHVDRALEQLKEQGFGSLQDGYFTADQKALRDWERCIVERIVSKDWAASHIVDWNDVRECAGRMLDGRENTD